MKAEDFVKAINSIQLGCITKRSVPIKHETESEIVKLILNYNLNNFEVHYISFCNEYLDYFENANTAMIGSGGSELVHINKLTQEIELMDYIVPGHVLYKCAVDEEHFLNALAVLFKMVSERPPNSWDDIERAKLEAYAAAEAAGGEKYEDFYLAQTGYYDLLDDQG